MRRILLLTLSLGILSPAAPAQQPGNAESLPTAQSATDTAPDRATIDALLGRYEKAYYHQNLDELIAVWPSLRSDKKQLQKIKNEFGRAGISDVNVTMDVQQILPGPNGDFILRCKRDEQYKKLQTSSYSSADNVMGSMPTQNPGPSQASGKKDVHKTTEAWVTVHRIEANWAILFVSDKKPR